MRSTFLLCTAARCLSIFYCLTYPSTALADNHLIYIEPDGNPLPEEKVKEKGSRYTETYTIMMPEKEKMTSVKVPRWYKKQSTPGGPFYILHDSTPEYPSKAEDWERPATKE